MIGLVAIGRNEGPRLLACLKSALAAGIDPSRIVYVDSGSTDDSPAAARNLGVIVVELDVTAPFTAARGRNAGFEKLLHDHSAIQFIQFIDSDCELAEGWIPLATTSLTTHPKVAAVCGRRRERNPQASVYNRLCDIEWNTPIGETDACGGDVMIRAASFTQITGYNPHLIAGEDPELCVRLRKAGWKILRLDAEMTLHDAAILSLRQWWRRTVRAGHAFAQVSALNGYWADETRSNWAWGLVLPLCAEAAFWPTRGISLGVAALAYLVLWFRIRHTARRRGLSSSDANLLARYGLLAKFAMASGQLKYWFNRARRRNSRIIEYKNPPVKTL